MLATAYHPELVSDERVHRHFVQTVRALTRGALAEATEDR